MPIKSITQGDVVLHRSGVEGIAQHAADSGTVTVEVQGKQYRWAFADLVDVAPPNIGKAAMKQSSKNEPAESRDQNGRSIS